MDPERQVETNVNRFMEQFGVEGFLKLFFTNYLFELSTYYLFSEQRGKVDSTTLMFFDYKGNPYSSKQIEEFRRGLRSECAKKAETIAAELKEKETAFLDKRLLSDPKVARIVATAVESIVKDVVKGR